MKNYLRRLDLTGLAPSTEDWRSKPGVGRLRRLSTDLRVDIRVLEDICDRGWFGYRISREFTA